MGVKISVVIGTYNQKETLRSVLESLFKQTLAPDLYEIIVIDSSSADGTDQMIKTFSPAPCGLRYFRVENRGKPAARNRGIDESKGKIIFLTDADMVADCNLLMEHVNAHQKHPNAAFEGKTINPDKKPYIKGKLKAQQKLKWSYFLSGNLSIKKQTIIEAGKFDLDFSGYGWEDIELGYRLQNLKVPLYYLPFAVNYHDHPVSDEDLLKRKYNMGRSAAIFFKKHPNFEIKYFLGLNPLANSIFNFLDKKPNRLNFIKRRSSNSPFFRYLLEEYYYRKGLQAEGVI